MNSCRLLPAWMMAILTIVSASATRDIWLTTSGKDELSYDAETFITQLTSYDKQYFVFMTTTDFEIYKLKDYSKVEHVVNITHELENTEDEFVAAFITHHYIGYLTKDVFFLFMLSDDKKTITFREEYPALYFDVQGFTSVYTVNPWRNIAIIKTGYRTVHYFDFKPIKKPLAVKLELTNKGDADISQIKSFGSDLHTAIRYLNDEIEVFSVKYQKTLVEYRFYDKITYTNYDYITNQFIVILAKSPARIIDCANLKVVGNLPIEINQKNSKLYRTGTQIMLLINPKQLFFYDINNYNKVGTVNAPSFYDFETVMQMSNLVMTVNKSATTYNFSIHELETDNVIFCHASCRGGCTKPFVPCRKIGEGLLALCLAVVLMVSGFSCFRYFVRQIESKAALREILTQEEKTELKNSMISRNPLGASILIQERRTLRSEKMLRVSSQSRSRRASRNLDETLLSNAET